MEAIFNGLKNDRFAAANGIEFVELRPGWAKARLKIEDRHLNSLGLAHGGAIFTLAAFAFVAAANTGGKAAVGVSTTLSFLKAIRAGTLTAEATEVSRSKRISTCTVRVADDTGELIALFQGTAFIKDEPFPQERAQ